MHPRETHEYDWPKTVTRLKPELDSLLKATCELSGLRRSQIARTLLQCWLKSIYGPESEGWTAERVKKEFYAKTPEGQKAMREGLKSNFKIYVDMLAKGEII